jgi:Ion channel
VGYGDIGPETAAGRIIAVAVMLTGIAYVAILTAAIAQQFLAVVLGDERQQEADIMLQLDAPMPGSLASRLGSIGNSRCHCEGTSDGASNIRSCKA